MQARATAKYPKRRVSLVPADESPHDKFIRLGNDRAKKAIKAIRRIGLLGSHSYERTSEEIEKLHRALQKAVEETVMQLKGRRSEEIGDIL